MELEYKIRNTFPADSVKKDMQNLDKKMLRMGLSLKRATTLKEQETFIKHVTD